MIADPLELTETFSETLVAAPGNGVTIRTRNENWPDDPMENGPSAAEDMVAFVGGAEVLVTHLVPMLRGMFKRLPGLWRISFSPDGPFKFDRAASRDRRWNCALVQRSAPADRRLLQTPNATLTPHIAGVSGRTIASAAEPAANQLYRFIAGDPPRNPNKG